jgi:nucleotide-binding universal stress UspA family protein
MSFKNLLVHIDDGKACELRLDAAFALAGELDAHLTGLYVAPDPYLPGNVRAEVPASFLSTLQDQLKERLETAVALYTRKAEAAGLTPDCRTAHCAGASLPEVVALHARYADLTILGQPEPDGPEGIDGPVTESVVLSSGRPALIVPYIGAGARFGRRVMIAWDAGREAARAVADAMPLLQRADSVTVLAINPRRGDHGPQPGADISLHLARHGLKVEAQSLEAEDLSVAEALLSRLADEDIDLLVMGAYGHSRIRELVLGGVTREIFRQMTVPVLMSH